MSSKHPFRLFELNYDSEFGLNQLEAFGEGIFYVGKMLKVERRYIRHGCCPADQRAGFGDKFTFYTRITNVSFSSRVEAQVDND